MWDLCKLIWWAFSGLSPKRLRFGSIDRLIFVGLFRGLSTAHDALAIVQPATVIRRHRAGFRSLLVVSTTSTSGSDLRQGQGQRPSEEGSGPSQGRSLLPVDRPQRRSQQKHGDGHRKARGQFCVVDVRRAHGPGQESCPSTRLYKSGPRPIHGRRQLGGRRPRPLVGVSRRHDGPLGWDAVSAPREYPASSDCYSAAIAAAATSPAITLASRNVPITTSSILSQSASTLPLCCPNSGAGPTAGGASPKRTGQPLIV